MLEVKMRSLEINKNKYLKELKQNLGFLTKKSRMVHGYF